MPYQIKYRNIEPNKNTGDPLLAMAGQIAGSALGTAVGGPMGGQIGGSLGGQLAGTGTIDPTKTAEDMATGAIGDAATGTISDFIGEGMVAADLGTDIGSEQTEMLYNQINDADPDLRLTGFFNQGGPISYAACGNKMKYRNEGSYMPEQPKGEELKALEEQMKKRMMIEQMYENNRRAQEEAGEMMPEMEGYGPLRYYRFEKGGKADAVKADIQNENTISKMGIDQFGEQANMIRKQNLWSNEEMYGPLKAVKYKSAGGDVYEKSYYEKGGKV